MAFNLDFLLLRRPRLDYISPPICEVFFSSTGVVIELEPFASSTITGLALGGTGGGNLIWDVFPEAVCYNIYKESGTPEIYDLVLECVPGPDIPFPNPPGCYKVSAITSSGETDLSDPFCISPVLPTVLTLPAEDVEMTTAVLNGAVNPMGFPASVFFQWGETLAYGNFTPAVSVGSGLSNVSFSDVLEGLSANTIYHYRAVATNGAVLVVGLDEEFMTPGGGGCANVFENLVWGAPIITEQGNGGSSVVSVLDENFSVEVTANQPLSDPNGERIVEVTGTFSYIGPALNCNLHVTHAPNVQGTRFLSVDSSVDGTLVDTTLVFDGTFDVPFVVPASVGAVISVYIRVRALGFDGDPGHAKTNGFLTSCP